MHALGGKRRCDVHAHSSAVRPRSRPRSSGRIVHRRVIVRKSCASSHRARSTPGLPSRIACSRRRASTRPPKTWRNGSLPHTMSITSMALQPRARERCDERSFSCNLRNFFAWQWRERMARHGWMGVERECPEIMQKEDLCIFQRLVSLQGITCMLEPVAVPLYRPYKVKSHPLSHGQHRIYDYG